MQSLQCFQEANLKNKTILLRADFNVPIFKGEITDTNRIDATVPTIKKLLEQNCKIIIASHLGRPESINDKEFSLKIVANKLEEIINEKVHFIGDIKDPTIKDKISSLPNNSISMLENLRYYKEESKGDIEFAKHLASLADIYVSDAFAVLHRKHASVTTIAEFLPSYAGYLVQKEVRSLTSTFLDPARPATAVIGGAKISTKLSTLSALAKQLDYMIITGGISHTMNYALGIDIGNSLSEKHLAQEALDILKIAKDNNCVTILNVDNISAPDVNSPKDQIKNIKNNEDMTGYKYLDVGPQTLDNAKEIIAISKTVLWNGPLGVFEVPPYDEGTNDLATFVGDLTKEGKLTSVAGGGDTISSLQISGAAANFSYLSTAGGAFLEWLENKTLPGIEVLTK